ncbi:MAG: hypothetical protein E6R09_19430 [Rhodocyclaceae bacterium]|nr:MAG: hypothetical protein E6R09_19430 [Rhodocyclaceae bacterium]
MATEIEQYRINGSAQVSELSTFEWSAFISACVIQVDGPGEASLPLTFIDPIQRRRLSALAKVSLGVMNECAKGVQDYQVVYASRHGELARTTDLLNQLAVGDDVSPMGFSLAVLNGTAGVFSIAAANHAPCSAVSSGTQTFQMGLLEASVQAMQSGAPVLFVYADAPIPEVYGAKETRNTGPLHALALLLHGSSAPGRTQLRCWSEECAGHRHAEPSPSLAFAQSWLEKSPGKWADDNQLFSWSFQ